MLSPSLQVKEVAEALTPRERFLKCLRGEPTDRLPLLGGWGSPTPLSKYAPQWEREGMPAGVDPMVELGFDCADDPSARRGWEEAPVILHAVPLFPTPPLPDVGPYYRFVNPSSGHVYRKRRPDANSPSDANIIEKGPVSDRADWREYRKHFRLTPEGRYGEDWDAWAEHSKSASHPVGMRLLGSFNAVCNTLWLRGEQGLLMSFHDRPGFVREIVDYMTDFNIAVSEKALREAKLDFVYVGDMLGDPETTFISPGMHEDFFAESYRRLFPHLRQHGIGLILYQARYGVNPYLPMWAELDLDGFLGIPRARDLQQLRADYGDRFAVVGGIDRRPLRHGTHAAIEREVEEVVEVAQQGKTIPTLCDRLMPGTPYANYYHYARHLAQKLRD